MSLPAVGELLGEDPQHEAGLLVRLEGGGDDDVATGRQLEAPGHLAVVHVLARAARQKQRVFRGALLVEGPEVPVLQLQPSGNMHTVIHWAGQVTVRTQSERLFSCTPSYTRLVR